MSNCFETPWTVDPPGSSNNGIFPGKNTGVGFHLLLQEILPTQGSSLSLLHCRWNFYYWASGSYISQSIQTKNKYCFHFLFNKWFSLFKLPLFCKLRLLLFSLSVMSSSLQLHGLQHTKPPCPLPSPEVCPSSCPLHQWCHLAISSSDKLFFCPQSFPALGTFPMSWLFTSSDQNTGASLPSKEYSGLIFLKIDCFDLLLSKWISGVFFSTTVWRKQFCGSLTSFWSRFHNHTWPLVRP